MLKEQAMLSMIKTLLLAGAAAATVSWLVPPGFAAADPSRAGDKRKAVATADYVGDETCLTCHEDRAAGYRDSAHGRAWNMRTPMATGGGCESCHGAGAEHAESGDKTKIKTFAVLSPADINDTCMSCHNRGEHVMFDSSAHAGRNMSCTSCHSVHASRSADAQLKKVTETETCATCHKDKAMKLHRSAHMPVSEGKMQCSSCHNAHGTVNEKLLRAGTSVNESCISCHAEKRGPFLWEHAAVTENCTSCHDAHGSNNDRMLVAKQPFLCQRCHVTARHPPTIYDGYLLRTSQNANKIYGRSCAVCHQNIHGSNAPSGKAFLR
jgi:DmsE family decaheme c-type cytochrome